MGILIHALYTEKLGGKSAPTQFQPFVVGSFAQGTYVQHGITRSHLCMNYWQHRILICFRWLFPRITLSLHIMSYLYVLLRNLTVEYLGEKRSSKLYVSLFHNQSRRQWISIRILKWTPECGHKSKERCVVKLCLYVICFCMCVAHCLLWNGPISELHFLSRRSCMFPIEMFCNCMSLWFHIIVLKTNYI